MSAADGWLGDAYLWVKAAHVIFVIFWVAGLLMAPRLLVYWHGLPGDSPDNALWASRADRLRRIILNPGAIVVFALGLMLAFSYGWAGNGWLHAKFALALAMGGFHGWCTASIKRFARGERPYSERTLRMLNELPSLLTIVIVILVVVKPF